MQFDAMLLSGAFRDPGDAMDYFRGNGEDTLKEAEVLKNLAKIEGFLSYEGWQMEPITRRRLGYEIYLVGSYKRSLDKYMRKNAFTHLGAVNLGLDLCAALSLCRQSGFLYADLKPSNIFVSEKKEYRIGDLGFLRLDSLRYASLPERYFSPYTPPELLDPMTSVNLTVDTYAVGMILYQLYNDGQLPFTGNAPTESLPSPCHADYEMAEIIMKAIHPDPEQRWMDPKDLGKAIASYMQKNAVNDIPITPFIPLDVKPEDIVPVSSEKTAQENSNESSEENTNAEETAVNTDSLSVSSTSEETEASSETSESTEEPEDLPAVEEESAPETSEADTAEEIVEQQPPEVESAEPVDTVPPSVEASVIQQTEDEPPLIGVSEEVARILSKADDIIAHEIPEEVVFQVEETPADPFAFAVDDSEEPDDSIPSDPIMEEDTADSTPEKKKKTKHFENPSRKKKIKKFFSSCFTLLLLVCLGFGGFWYYQNVYLQTIDSLSITGTQTQITVLIDTAVEESRLTIYCSAENGKRYSEPVIGGKATFSGLQPSTPYTIQVDMEGFHKLVGKTSDVFTTDATTQVLTFQAVAGPEDGSVMLDFTVEGDEPDFWNIRYSADGEEELMETVTSHSAMITGLSVGKVYTFTLDGGKGFNLGGETSIQYLASRLILAEDISIASLDGSDITVHWKTPGDVVVDNWNVRFYDGYGFEEQVTVTENEVQFAGIDPDSHYTVEITAAGMTQPSRISISSDPLNVSAFKIDETKQTEMKITWEYTGNPSERGWVLIYSVDGSGSQVIQCEKASAEIAPLIPGAKYEFMLEAADGRTVFNNRLHHQAEEAKEFTEHNFALENVSIDLLKTPDGAWTYETISETDFTNTFHAGDSASMVLRSSSTFYLPGNKTKILFVFRDSYGNVLPELVSEVTHTWKSIWMAGDTKTGELDIPKLPNSPGSYKMELYFNGCSVEQFDITIAE